MVAFACIDEHTGRTIVTDSRKPEIEISLQISFDVNCHRISSVEFREICNVCEEWRIGLVTDTQEYRPISETNELKTGSSVDERF